MSTKYSLEQIRSTLYSGLICDVLDQMGYHHQYLGCEMDALLPDTVVFGKAFTAVATQVYSMPADPLTAQCRVLDQMQPGEVFVLTTRGEYSCAILGELMATAIKSKGGTGVPAGVQRPSAQHLEGPRGGQRMPDPHSDRRCDHQPGRLCVRRYRRHCGDPC